MTNDLKSIRMSNGFSQEYLARKLDISQKTVSSWEVGRTTPKPSQMQQIEDLFGVPKEKIFFTAFNYKNELRNEAIL